MALGESHSGPIRPLLENPKNPESVWNWIMNQMEKSGGEIPRVIIFSDSGPLAGDLGACLSGRFLVQRVTSLSAADLALNDHSEALLVVPGREATVGPEFIPLFRRAVKRNCRVLLLGCVQPDLDEDLREKIQVLPQFPSPDLLFSSLLNGKVQPQKAKTAEGD